MPPTCGCLLQWMAASRFAVVLSWVICLHYVPGLNLVVGKVVRITRTLKVLTSFPVLYLDKDIMKLTGLAEEAVNVFDGVLDIASESLPQTYSVLTLYICCNAVKCVISIQFYSPLFD